MQLCEGFFDEVFLIVGVEFSFDDFAGNLLTDEYDSKSSFITIHSGDEIIGGMRMVRNSEIGFPHEKETGVQLWNLGETVDSGTRKKMLKINKNNLREITRFIGKRTNKYVLTFDLAKGWYWYCFYNAVEACFMAVDMRLFLLCEKLFIPLRPVGIPKYCEGSWVIPSVLILEDMMTSLKDNNKELWQYILDKFNIAGEWKD